LVRRLRQTKARLIWCSTTPVPSGSLGRIPADVEKYNAVAEKVMNEASVDIDDLYKFAHERLEKIQRPRDVHFTDEGYAVLAQQVARSIATTLAKDLHGTSQNGAR
jgi:hypothetical protein